jgi:hypothetical protein
MLPQFGPEYVRVGSNRSSTLHNHLLSQHFVRMQQAACVRYSFKCRIGSALNLRDSALSKKSIIVNPKRLSVELKSDLVEPQRLGGDSERLGIQQN